MKNARPGLAFLLLLCFSASPMLAQQGFIAGTVTGQVDGTGLSTVQVQVLRSDGSVVSTTLSGSSGAYRIPGISAGTYSVTFGLAGWEHATETDVVVTEGETTSVNVTLLERAFTLNPISVTTSKKVEKALDAPAAVQVVDAQDIIERPATSLTDHVKEKAAVDVITAGVQSNYVVVRGFNNIFSGASLSLTDNRIARVPSLRANISHLQPTTNADIDRVEIVLGPGSALYGPNAANGVVHYLTRSPIDDPGATFSIAGGLRQQGSSSKTVPVIDLNQNDLPDDFVTVDQASSTEETLHFEGRYAWASADRRFGVKLSGQYFEARDFGFIDEVEVQQQTIAGVCALVGFDPTNDACANFSGDLDLGTAEGMASLRTRVANVAGGRDPDLERYTFDLRTDIRPNEDVNIVLSGGRTTAVNSIDLTGVGGGQVQNWDLWYGQARTSYKRWFGQLFFNTNSNEETYLLRSGRPLIDKSSLFVAQLQHGADLGDVHELIYGVDFLHTVPKSDGTINGRHEDDDTIDEIGGYVQYEGAMSDVVDLVLAARVDKHSRLDDPVFSPRAAIVYKPDEANSLRLTFNRAFTTPTTLNFFLDLSFQTLPITGPFRYDVRLQGTSEDGFQFMREAGVPMHMSPFNPLLGGSQRQLLPTTTGQLWAEAREVIRAGDAGAGALLDAVAEPSPTAVPVVGALIDPETGGFGAPILDLAAIEDPRPLRETTWQTLEAGYKGLLGERWLVAVNGYWTRVNDFVSALQPISANVFLPEAAVQAHLQAEFRQLVGPQPPFPFGSEAEADATAAAIAGNIGQLPLGSLVPTSAGGVTDSPILFTYRNLGDFDLFGADLAINFLLTDNWEITATAAWVSDEQFDSGTEIVPLNAPSIKGSFGARYRNEDSGVSAALRARFVDGFPVASGVYQGDVDAYQVFDVNFGYTIPGSNGLRAQLDVQNVLDENYASFPGTPALGRYTILRMLWAP